MDFNDPNEPWRQTGFDPYKGLSLKERQQAGCIHGVLFVVAVVVLIIIAALCHGCTTTKEVIVEKVRTDTVYQNHMQHDSIHIRDSVLVERWTHGDTVYVVKDRWKTEWRERLKTDTVYMSKTDTVYICIGVCIYAVVGIRDVNCGHSIGSLLFSFIKDVSKVIFTIHSPLYFNKTIVVIKIVLVIFVVGHFIIQ